MKAIEFHFVEPELTTPNLKEHHPASYVRFSFQSHGPIRKATLYTTAMGVYEPWMNGKRISDQHLLPGFTNYHVRVQYLTTDITDSVCEGRNVVAAVIGDGWYRGAIGLMSGRGYYGDKVKFAASVCLETVSGEQWFYTDASSVRATQNGPLRMADNKTDEIVDMRCEMPGWTEPDFDDSSWHEVLPSSYEGKTIPQEGEDILEHERFPATVMKTPNGETVLDFGQNLSGHVEFTVTGKAGTTVQLMMAETMDENGNFTIKNLYLDGNDKKKKDAPTENFQTLTYTLREGKQTYKSTFLISGYRYVKLIGWPEEVKAENFSSISIYSNYKRTGSFECSEEKINRFVQNVIWAQNSNFVDYPTDCPTRERSGWCGDINVYAETACYLTDPERFLRKWFGDFMSLQGEDGSLPYIVPECPMSGFGIDGNKMCRSSAGWSDALINVAWTLYQFYGDRAILVQVYDAAKKYVDFNVHRAKKKHLFHLFKTGSHQKYIIDTGYHWGEWLEPGGDMMKDAIRAMFFPDSEVATAWFYSSAHEVSEMAKLLGKEDDARTYSELANQIRSAYQKEFLRDGKVVSDRQCRYVRPVFMGLVDEAQAKDIIADLNQMVIKNGYKIGTGFLTTYKVLQTLTDYGYADTAYKMMEQEACPGWLYEINKGATTTWENWLGINEEGVPKDSLNHYAPGAACAWLFSRVGGIRPVTPGFSEIEIAPVPGGKMRFANTCFDSRRGRIVSNWKLDGDEFMLDVEIPESVTATVILPDGQKIDNAKSGKYTCKLM